MAASSAAFKDFRSAGVVLFADSKKDWSALPKGAQSMRSKAGNTIPMIFVTSADGTKGIQGISYNSLKGGKTRDAARELKKFLKENPDVALQGAEDSAEEKEKKDSDAEKTTEEKKTENGLLAESQAWTNSQGVSITAAIQKVEGGKVYFVMANKSVVPYDVTNLSDESQAKIKKLQE